MASSPPDDGWSPLPEGWTWSDVGHGALDIAGMVPIIGEAADLTNAAWLASEEKYLDAGLSIISMVPVVGDVVGKGGKLATRAGGKLAEPAVKALAKMDFAKVLAPLKSNKKLAPHVAKIEEALVKWREDVLGNASCTPAGKSNCHQARKIRKIDAFSTPKDKSVFYSGPGNREKALHAGKNGAVPIDNTPGGRALDDQKLYGEFSPVSQEEADRIWSEASKKFAEGASGDVTAFVHGAKPDRVFGATELPALLKNSNVESINGISTSALRAAEKAKPGSAFALVVSRAPM